MKKNFYISITVLFIFLFAGCASVQKQTEKKRGLAYQTQINDRPDASYEKDILPFIIEQINHTAAAFFYDLDKFNRSLAERGRPIRELTVENYIVGDNETGGVCQDYASHFIDNYKGLGEIFYVRVDYDGDASLLKRIKPFEKSDIVINDTMTVDAFVEKTYQYIIANEKANEEGANIKWQDEKEQWAVFYTRTRNGTIYWTETQTDFNTVTPFKKEHIKINQKNYQAERNRQREEFAEKFYSNILQSSDERKGGWGWSQGLRSESNGLSSAPVAFNTSNDGKLFLIEEISIATPKHHAGETDISIFSNHAWVRIAWRDKTIDIDPTWYDNGKPLEWGAVEEIIPNKINTYPVAYSSYLQLPNTRLISPITGTLQSGSTQTFIISSQDYSEFSVIINDEWHNFTKNNKTGNYELSLKIPSGIDTIDIFAVAVSGSRRSGTSLIKYNVVK